MNNDQFLAKSELSRNYMSSKQDLSNIDTNNNSYHQSASLGKFLNKSSNLISWKYNLNKLYKKFKSILSRLRHNVRFTTKSSKNEPKSSFQS